MNERERRLLSTAAEPVFSGEGMEVDPSEAKVARRELREGELPRAEIDVLRDSVLSEPSLGTGLREDLAGARVGFGDWLALRKLRVGGAALVVVTVLAGLAGGPFAIFGALASSSARGGNFLIWLSYAIVLGPLLEEMLKQSGALFLLERRPYWLKHGWQFPVIAVISAGLFATIENLMYINGPLRDLKPEVYTAAVSFRWRYCTLLHIGCSLIASVGLWRVWRHQVEEEEPAQLSFGYRWIVSAVVCHGLYNLAASTLIKFDAQ